MTVTREWLLRQIKVYMDSGFKFSPEGLADHLWGNMAQLESLRGNSTVSPTPESGVAPYTLAWGNSIVEEGFEQWTLVREEKP